MYNLLPAAIFASGVWGFYADGFFDRRELDTAMGSSAVTNVSVSTGKVTSNDRIANIGQLFFSTGNKSIFFPIAGYRSGSGGASAYAGSLVGAWHLDIRSIGPNHNSSNW